jgi:hypothetical protein
VPAEGGVVDVVMLDLSGFVEFEGREVAGELELIVETAARIAPEWQRARDARQPAVRVGVMVSWVGHQGGGVQQPPSVAAAR